MNGRKIRKKIGKNDKTRLNVKRKRKQKIMGKKTTVNIMSSNTQTAFESNNNLSELEKLGNLCTQHLFTTAIQSE